MPFIIAIPTLKVRHYLGLTVSYDGLWRKASTRLRWCHFGFSILDSPRAKYVLILISQQHGLYLNFPNPAERPPVHALFQWFSADCVLRDFAVKWF